MKIITTVGTSLLNNFQDNDSRYNEDIKIIKAGKYLDNRGEIEGLAKIIAERMVNNARSCAEGQCYEAITKLYENDTIDEVALISSDTGDGALCSEALKIIFQG
jgi:CRISPR/Cas system-associated protein Csm6